MRGLARSSAPWRAGLILAAGAVVFAIAALLTAGGATSSVATQQLLVAPTGLGNANRSISIKPIYRQVQLLDDVLTTVAGREQVFRRAGAPADAGSWSVEAIGAEKAATASILATARTTDAAVALARAGAAQSASLFAASPRASYSIRALGRPITNEVGGPGIGVLPIVLAILAAAIAAFATRRRQATEASSPTRIGAASPGPVAVPLARQQGAPVPMHAALAEVTTPATVEAPPPAPRPAPAIAPAPLTKRLRQPSDAPTSAARASSGRPRPSVAGPADSSGAGSKRRRRLADGGAAAAALLVVGIVLRGRSGRS